MHGCACCTPFSVISLSMAPFQGGGLLLTGLKRYSRCLPPFLQRMLIILEITSNCVTYNKSLQDRVKEGITRLTRLAPLPLDCKDKVNDIHAGGFQTCFYGAEIVLLGQDLLECSLHRGECVASTPPASMPLECLCFVWPDGTDPFLWVLSRCAPGPKNVCA